MAKKPTFSLSSDDIKVSSAGEVVIANPDLLSKIADDLEAVGPDIGGVADNYVGCGGNAYQCGRANDFDELVNRIREVKTRG